MGLLPPPTPRWEEITKQVCLQMPAIQILGYVLFLIVTTVIIQQIITCVYVAWHFVVEKEGRGEGNERVGGWGGLDILLSTWMHFVICCHFVYYMCGVCVCVVRVWCVRACVCVCVHVCVWNKTPIQHTFCAIQIIFIFPSDHSNTPCIKQCPNIKHVQSPEAITLMTAWGTTGGHLTVSVIQSNLVHNACLLRSKWAFVEMWRLYSKNNISSRGKPNRWSITHLINRNGLKIYTQHFLFNTPFLILRAANLREWVAETCSQVLPLCSQQSLSMTLHRRLAIVGQPFSFFVSK